MCVTAAPSRLSVWSLMGQGVHKAAHWAGAIGRESAIIVFVKVTPWDRHQAGPWQSSIAYDSRAKGWRLDKQLDNRFHMARSRSAAGLERFEGH